MRAIRFRVARRFGQFFRLLCWLVLVPAPLGRSSPALPPVESVAVQSQVPLAWFFRFQAQGCLTHATASLRAGPCNLAVLCKGLHIIEGAGPACYRPRRARSLELYARTGIHSPNAGHLSMRW